MEILLRIAHNEQLTCGHCFVTIKPGADAVLRVDPMGERVVSVKCVECQVAEKY